jgi:hypothetical protein
MLLHHQRRTVWLSPVRRRLLIIFSIVLVASCLILPNFGSWVYFALWLPQFLLRRVLDSLLGRALTRPLLVVGYGLWDSPAEVLNELHILRTLFRSAGRELDTFNPRLPLCAAYYFADVELISVLDRPHLQTPEWCQHWFRAPMAVAIITDHSGDKLEFRDQMTGIADVSFGVSHEFAASNYLHMPIWLPQLVQSTSEAQCKIRSAAHATGIAGGDEQEWSNRERFAALLTSDARYPRGLLLEAFQSSLTDLGTVVSVGTEFHNSEWPRGADFAGPDGKAKYLQQFRFLLTPSDTSVNDGAHNSATVLDALENGMVPVYWGAAPIESAVFHPGRILKFNDTLEDGLQVLTNHVRALSQDATYRTAFFQQPWLQPTADAWVQNWCRHATDLLSAALLKHGLIASSQKHQADAE